MESLDNPEVVATPAEQDSRLPSKVVFPRLVCGEYEVPVETPKKLPAWVMISRYGVLCGRTNRHRRTTLSLFQVGLCF